MKEKEIKKTCFWNATFGCNLNCSYCFQKFGKNGEILRHPEEKVVVAILRSIQKLPGQWQILMSGGELFVMPSFGKIIVPFLMKETDHHLKVITNLSCSERKYLEFLDVTRGRLDHFSGSIHLEHLNSQEKIEVFLNKAKTLSDRCKELDVKFNLNCVLFPGKLNQIKEINQRCQELGIMVFLQVLKESDTEVGMKAFNYCPKDLQIIEELMGNKGLFSNPVRSFKGKVCGAGTEYFIIEPNGDVQACHEDNKGSMGNMATGTFKLKKKEMVCKHQICSCGIPAVKGIVA